jgi:hypothetical protein
MAGTRATARWCWPRRACAARSPTWTWPRGWASTISRCCWKARPPTLTAQDGATRVIASGLRESDALPAGVTLRSTWPWPCCPTRRTTPPVPGVAAGPGQRDGARDAQGHPHRQLLSGLRPRRCSIAPLRLPTPERTTHDQAISPPLRAAGRHGPGLHRRPGASAGQARQGRSDCAELADQARAHPGGLSGRLHARPGGPHDCRAAVQGAGPAGGGGKPRGCGWQHRRRRRGQGHRQPHHRRDDQRQHDHRQDAQPGHAV